MEPILRVRDLVVRWDGKPILRGIDFDVARGSVFAILGGSGCGKSTVLRHLIGLAEPMSGSIEIAGVGKPSLGLEPPAFGVMFQGGALFGSMTLEENVALPLQKWTRLPKEAISAVARARLRLVDLAGYESFLPSAISGGMKKRAGIARALALDPQLLFLDEPSAGLDPITSRELDDLILTLSRTLGVTVVLVSHELASIFRVADQCIMLDREAGTIIAHGKPAELRDHATHPTVRAFFHREAAHHPNPTP